MVSTCNNNFYHGSPAGALACSPFLSLGELNVRPAEVKLLMHCTGYTWNTYHISLS